MRDRACGNPATPVAPIFCAGRLAFASTIQSLAESLSKHGSWLPWFKNKSFSLKIVDSMIMEITEGPTSTRFLFVGWPTTLKATSQRRHLKLRHRNHFPETTEPS
jgi:hypothetical protein